MCVAYYLGIIAQHSPIYLLFLRSGVVILSQIETHGELKKSPAL
jgi:hypothetical protein